MTETHENILITGGPCIHSIVSQIDLNPCMHCTILYTTNNLRFAPLNCSTEYVLHSTVFAFIHHMSQERKMVYATLVATTVARSADESLKPGFGYCLLNKLFKKNIY